jgi:hypothetical protein
LGALDNLTLKWSQILVFAEQHGEHLFGSLSAERIESELSVMGPAAPLVVVLRPVVHEQQNAGISNRIDG